MSNTPIEARQHIIEAAILAKPNSQFDITPVISNSLESAFSANLSITPTVSTSWGEKTHQLLKDSYEKVSPVAQRAVHFFGHLSGRFPDCASLESMTRQILKTGDLIPENIAETLNRFQERSKRNGSTIIYEVNSVSISPAILLLLSELPRNEQQIWIKLTAVVPPLLVASIRSRQNKKIRDIPEVWNGVGQELKTKDDYNRFIDEPAQAAVRHLNKLGIETDYSSANKADAGTSYGATIRFYYNQLSPENRKIAKELGLVNEYGYVWIDTKISLDDDAKEVSKKLLKAAKKFKNQRGYKHQY